MTRTSDLKARILDAARREPSATRRAASRQTALVIATAIVVDLGLFALFGGVHPGTRPLGFLVATQVGSSLFALVALWVAFGRGRSMLGRPRQWLVAIAVATPVVLLSWMLLWSALYPEVAIAVPGRIGVRCLLFSLAVAAWPLALLLRARHERNPVAPVAAGAARGAAIGALAWMLVSLWCPMANLPHLALGHFLPLLILSALGSWLGNRLTGVASGHSRSY